MSRKCYQDKNKQITILPIKKLFIYFKVCRNIYQQITKQRQLLKMENKDPNQTVGISFTRSVINQGEEIVHRKFNI